MIVQITNICRVDTVDATSWEHREVSPLYDNAINYDQFPTDKTPVIIKSNHQLIGVVNAADY